MKSTGFENYGTKHLMNLKKWIERKAKNGYCYMIGGGYLCEPDSLWAEEICIKGKEVKKFFNYKNVKKELKRREKMTGREREIMNF